MLGTDETAEIEEEPAVILREHQPDGIKAKYHLIEGKDYIKQGWWGTGPPQSVWKNLIVQGRWMTDGGGLCCPGRWSKSNRSLPPLADEVFQILDQGVKRLLSEMNLSPGQLCLGIICGKDKEDPWEGKILGCKQSVKELVENRGFPLSPMESRPHQVIDFSLMKSVAEMLGDPDYGCVDDYLFGANLGVDMAMPRTHTVWPPKHKRKLPEFNEEEQTMLCDNYPSTEKISRGPTHGN